MARESVGEYRDGGARERSRWGFLVRIAVTLLCFAALFTFIDPVDLWAHLARLTASGLLLALSLHTLIILLLAWRWRSILHSLAAAVPFGLALRLTFITTFLNLVLPLSVGGDLGRMVLARNAGVAFATGVTAAVVDRVVGLLALGLLVTVGAALLPVGFLTQEARLVFLSLLPLMVFGLWSLRGVARRGAALLPALAGMAAPIEKARSLLRRPGVLALLLVQSLTAHLLAVGCAIAIARGLQLDLRVQDAFLLFPIVLLTALLPFSIGGWGMREAATISVFSLVGMPADGALALSLLFGLTQVALSGTGAVVLGWCTMGRDGAAP